MEPPRVYQDHTAGDRLAWRAMWPSILVRQHGLTPIPPPAITSEAIDVTVADRQYRAS
jgi:hypothetical protein